MWRDLISLQPRVAASGDGMSREDYIMQIARDLKGKTPGAYDLLILRKQLVERCGGVAMTPQDVVLAQEAERWNKLVSRMAGSLQDLQRALVGEIGMSDDLDSIGTSLFNGFLPPSWLKL